MSILLRAALLGGIAYLITRALSGESSRRSSYASGGSAPRRELHPGEDNVWPTSESQQGIAQQPTPAAAGPSS